MSHHEELVRALTRAAFEYGYELPMDMNDELNMPPAVVEAERALLTYIDDVLTKDRLKTREINTLTQEVRHSTCKHPPYARDITFCRICGQTLPG